MPHNGPSPYFYEKSPISVCLGILLKMQANEDWAKLKIGGKLLDYQMILYILLYKLRENSEYLDWKYLDFSRICHIFMWLPIIR